MIDRSKVGISGGTALGRLAELLLSLVAVGWCLAGRSQAARTHRRPAVLAAQRRFVALAQFRLRGAAVRQRDHLWQSVGRLAFEADRSVGAGSVVTRGIPPRSIAAGMPARVLRQF